MNRNWTDTMKQWLTAAGNLNTLETACSFSFMMEDSQKKRQKSSETRMKMLKVTRRHMMLNNNHTQSLLHKMTIETAEVDLVYLPHFKHSYHIFLVCLAKFFSTWHNRIEITDTASIYWMLQDTTISWLFSYIRIRYEGKTDIYNHRDISVCAAT